MEGIPRESPTVPQHLRDAVFEDLEAMTFRFDMTNVQSFFVNDAQIRTLCTQGLDRPDIDTKRLGIQLDKLLNKFAASLKKDVIDRSVLALVLKIETNAPSIAENLCRRIIDNSNQAEKDKDRAELMSSSSIQSQGTSREEDILRSSAALLDFRCDLERFVFESTLSYISDVVRGSCYPPARIHEQEFDAHHEMLKFCMTELDGSFAIEDVIVINGIPERAFASTCKEYISSYWSTTGLDLLKFVQQALENETACL